MLAAFALGTAVAAQRGVCTIAGVDGVAVGAAVRGQPVLVCAAAGQTSVAGLPLLWLLLYQRIKTKQVKHMPREAILATVVAFDPLPVARAGPHPHGGTVWAQVAHRGAAASRASARAPARDERDAKDVPVRHDRVTRRVRVPAA